MCSNCGNALADGDRVVFIDAGVYRDGTIEPTDSGGTYHLECWPGLAEDVDDSFAPVEPADGSVDDPTPTETTASEGTEASFRCTRCERAVEDGTAIVFVTDGVYHEQAPGFLARLFGGSGSSRIDPVGERGTFHDECWPGVDGGGDPLDPV